MTDHAATDRPGQSRALCVWAMLLLAIGPAAPGAAAMTLDVGPTRLLRTPSEAAARARDGDRIEIAPGEYDDCAVWRANNLVIEGTGPGVVIAGKSCEAKGIFVIVGDDVTVRNMTLAHARTPDSNGAGIRLQGRNLTVDKVRFIDNQNGILGGAGANSTVRISDSVFERNGVCAKACAHGVYFGPVGLVHIENSRFFANREGHHIKSRASRTEIVGCDIADGPNGTSSYLIDIPNGGSLLVRGNKLEKGPKTENESAAIAIGMEGAVNKTEQLLVENNRFTNDNRLPTALVWNLTGVPVVLRGNALSGEVVLLREDKPSKK
jgi:hypothetical protein